MVTVPQAASRHAVSTLELFFDLVFVFAITQVVGLVAADPTAETLLRGLLLLALVYWSWIAYSWLGTGADIDAPVTATATLSAMTAMFLVGILLPQWYSQGVWAFVAVLAYVLVRALHLVLLSLMARGNPGLKRAIGQLAASVAVAAVLLLVGAAAGGVWQTVLVAAAVLIDPLGAFLSRGQGWSLAADHFAERHGLIVIIALGESLIAVGLVTSDLGPSAALIVLAVLSSTVASLIYILYFRRTSDSIEKRLSSLTGAAQAAYGRDVYSYGHFGIVAGIVMLALALKKTAITVSEEGMAAHLHGIAVPALALGGILFFGALLVIRMLSNLPTTGALLALVVAIAGCVLMLWLPAILAPVVIGVAALVGLAAPTRRLEAQSPVQ